MIDTKWLYEAMGKDKIVLRMRLELSGSGKVRSTAHVLTRWQDDAATIGTHLIYRSEYGVSSNDLDPIRFNFLPANAHHGWQAELEKLTSKWPVAWQVEDPVVCTYKPQHKGWHRHIPTASPTVLVQLAMFQTQTAMYRLTSEPFSSVTAGIVSRQLRGLLDEHTRTWNNLTGIWANE